MRWTISLASAACLLAASGGASAAQVISSPASSATPVGSDNTVFPAGEIDPNLVRLSDVAVDDLAKRLGVSSDGIAVVTATLVTWPDSSLGCPVPGMRYQQVPVDGAVIELEQSGRFYRYHTGASRRPPFLCDQPLAPVPSATGR